MSEPGLRADKWLWYARFFKTRSLATKVCNAGQLRIAGSPVAKAHSQVRIGDVLTFPQARHVRVIKVLALAERRGPAAEARLLYEDLKPPDSANRLPKDRLLDRPGERPRGTGRPTKKQRRDIDRLTGEG